MVFCNVVYLWHTQDSPPRFCSCPSPAFTTLAPLSSMSCLLMQHTHNLLSTQESWWNPVQTTSSSQTSGGFLLLSKSKSRPYIICKARQPSWAQNSSPPAHSATATRLSLLSPTSEPLHLILPRPGLLCLCRHWAYPPTQSPKWPSASTLFHFFASSYLSSSYYLTN
jgi:hypothetical protein